MSLISTGITFLETCQNKDGSFNREVNGEEDPSPFFTALIHFCLDQLPKTKALRVIQQKAAHYILNQRSSSWSYNYLPRTLTDHFQPSRYPDDLDDTFCSLIALTRHDSALFSGETWAHIVNLLTATEVEPGGPYRTWLVPKEADPMWQDVDLVVNSNIAYFLSLHDIHLPKLTEFLSQDRSMNAITSPYYPERLVILYFLTRNSTFRKNKRIIRFLRNQRAKNPLQAALKIISAHQVGLSLNSCQEEYALIEKSNERCVWQAYPFCLDFATKENRYFAASSALTTAYCLVALSLTSSQKVKKYVKPSAKLASPAVYVNKRIKQRIKSLNEPLSSVLTDQVLLFRKKDRDDLITLLPFIFHQGLSKESLPLSDVYALCAATTYGWVAYSIYDDFLDNEGHPALLPAANVALREISSLFQEVMGNNTRFMLLFQQIMDQIEEANSFEVTHCRIMPPTSSQIVSNIILPHYPNTSYLAQRSAGHFLGPLALLYAKKSAPDYKEIASCTKFFISYLTARQLNDDAHDWEEDLLGGRLSYVVTHLLRYAQQNPDLHNSTLDVLLPRLRPYFWNTAIVSIAWEIKNEIKNARTALSTLSSTMNTSELAQLLIPLEKAADDAIAEHTNVTQFLDTYTQSDIKTENSIPGRKVPEIPGSHGGHS